MKGNFLNNKLYKERVGVAIVPCYAGTYRVTRVDIIT